MVSALAVLLVFTNVQISQAATTTNAGPLGCTNSGAKTVIEATTSTVAAIVKNTTSTVIIPMYASCTGDNYGEISVPFLVQ